MNVIYRVEIIGDGSIGKIFELGDALEYKKLKCVISRFELSGTDGKDLYVHVSNSGKEHMFCKVANCKMILYYAVGE